MGDVSSILEAPFPNEMRMSVRFLEAPWHHVRNIATLAALDPEFNMEAPPQVPAEYLDNCSKNRLYQIMILLR